MFKVNFHCLMFLAQGCPGLGEATSNCQVEENPAFQLNYTENVLFVLSAKQIPHTSGRGMNFC